MRIPIFWSSHSKEDKDIFISHSKEDLEIARSFIAVLKAAMDIPDKKIRCTSLPPFNLESGDDIDERLRDEAVRAKTFVVLFTPSSPRSIYVLLEMGARWGTRKSFHLLRAAGADVSILREPLKGRYSLSCDNRSDMEKLISSIANNLDKERHKPEQYGSQLDELISKSIQAGQSRKHQFAYADFDEIANSDLGYAYRDVPEGYRGDVVPFIIEKGRRIFNTKECQVPFRKPLRLNPPIRKPCSVYLLINSGDSQKRFEGETIGEIILEFSDNLSQTLQLVLGENIREWNIGSPGFYVTEAKQSGSSLVMFYDDLSASETRAVIDRLEIPVLQPNREKELLSIVFSSETTSPVKFFVSAITIEHST